MFTLEGVINKVFGSRSDRWLKKQRPVVARINELEAGIKKMSDDELRGQTAKFRQMIENGATTDELLPESFATIREAAIRTLGMRHYDVQLLGGVVLHKGMAAEMKTGEGKTLTATLPVYLNALEGKGAHVVTVNDYLASRDADWMGKVYNWMGLSVGKILQRERDASVKQRAYGADITYGTNNEFGFDYLRDNMKFRIEDYVQRGHHYAIVDEVDSILIDEARTPLIISGPANMDIDKYRIIDGVIPLLQAEIDYIVDEKARSVNLTDGGVDRVEEKLGIDNLFDPRNMEVLHHVNQALKAHTIFRRDRDYVVQNGKVIIVDENTGRLMPGRRWSDGLHQAVEAKEKVTVERESQIYASITFQNYFRMYRKLSGMTGTADTEREEFMNIYNLDVMVVPTNKPVIRKDHDDVVYKTQAEKFRAILDEIEEVHAKGQPILVGTVSVEKSEIVSRLLRQRGIVHEVLNARNHEREAQIVAQAGHKGSVTISTNMAGRGTDIKLGGDPEAKAIDEVGEGAPPEVFQEAFERHKVVCDKEKAEVLAAGGLHIIGTERHESRRIDNQLRGRSGRQGDPGSSRFYMALDDDLLRIFQGDKLVGWMEKMGLEDDEAIEHRWINKSIEDAQKRVEGHNFQIRKNLLEYDDVMNLQRKTIYEMRRRALEGDNVREMLIECIESLADDIMGMHVPENKHPEHWEIKELREQLETIFGVTWEDGDDEVRDMAWEEVRQRILDDAMAVYEAKEEEIGPDEVRQVERMLLLQFTDQFWKDHLLAMQRLRQGVGLRGYGQRNPLLEYKREGTDMFRMMCSMRDEAVVSRLLRMEIQPEDVPADISKAAARRLAADPQEAPAPAPAPAAPPEGGGMPSMAEVQARLAAMRQAPAPAAAPAAPKRPAKGPDARAFAEAHGLRRNDPCPCGSGKKFKKCCYNPKNDPPRDDDAVESDAPTETPAVSPAGSEAAAAVEEAAPALSAGDEAAGSEAEDAAAPSVEEALLNGAASDADADASIADLAEQTVADALEVSPAATAELDAPAAEVPDTEPSEAAADADEEEEDEATVLMSPELVSEALKQPETTDEAPPTEA
jgi:preprotein translocase subunit SecA